MQFFTYEIMSEIIGLTHAKDCDVYSLWKNVPLRKFLIYMDVSACKFSHERTSVYTFSHNFLCLGSTDMFSRSVSTTRRVHARVHTLKDGCLLTFLVTKTCLCVTFNISHRVFHLWPTWNDVQPHDFNLQNLLSRQILSFETMPENADLTNTKAVRRVHCKHSYLYETFLTCGDVSVGPIQRLTRESMSVFSF